MFASISADISSCLHSPKPLPLRTRQQRKHQRCRVAKTGHSTCSASEQYQQPVVHQAQIQPQSSHNVSRRASTIAVGLSLITFFQAKNVAAKDDALYKAFMDAFSANGFEAQDVAWSRAIQLAPDNAAAVSNRGTLRLQNNMWADAQTDLAHAVELEAQQRQPEYEDEDLLAGGSSSSDVSAWQRADPSTLNNLGNAEVALGRYDEARAHFEAAAAQRGSGMELLAAANLALVTFEIGNGDGAVHEVRQILRRDPNFLDMRAALTAFLYGSGKQAEAEGEWEKLQQSQDGFGGSMYSKSMAISRVQNRWPPRATAALDAFLSLSSEGKALGYDMQVHTYSFPV